MDDQLHLTRTIFTDKSTGGELYLPDGTQLCHTLEDVCRKEKLRQMTAIPCGLYEVVIGFSNRFQRPMPRLLSVPFFEGVLIHNGNYPEHTDGCLLVGKRDPKIPDAIFKSHDTFEDVFQKIRKLTLAGKLFIKIDGGFPPEEWKPEGGA